jgi:hypothetical protein
MMDQIVIDIREENDKIYCEVTVPRRNFYFPTKVVLRDDDVRRILEREGHKDLILEKGSLINNKDVDTPCHGIWRFRKNVTQERSSIVEKKPRRKRATKSRTSKQPDTKK